jgi:hypothetical protein
VPTRKAWRNRDRSAGEGVLALLEALRDGLGAEGVGLFDDDRAEPEDAPSPPNFWDAFDDPACARLDWDAWYRALRGRERVETECGCGRHRLHGFLIHGRWALLLALPPDPSVEGAAAIASSVKALAARLPPARDREKPSLVAAGRAPGQTDAEPVDPGEPVMWWAAKGRTDPQ